jgi:hypothetical protein
VSEPPYWRRHYGIDRPWNPTPKGRRGCMVMMVGFVILVAAVLVARLAFG